MNRNRLRELRIAAALTQEQLAERAGVPESTVGRMDANPRCAIALDTAAKLAPVLRVEPLDLLPQR